MTISRLITLAACLGLGTAGLALASGASAAESVMAAPRPAPLSEAQLDQVSGGQAPVTQTITTQTLAGRDSGNQVNAVNVQSGAVTFAGGALQGYTGIGNFVINTGNNNVLQGSLSVTVAPLR